MSQLGSNHSWMKLFFGPLGLSDAMKLMIDLSFKFDVEDLYFKFDIEDLCSK